MKKPLVIIGAGNVGGYLAYNLSDFPGYELVGLLDDDTLKHGMEMFGSKVLGGVDTLFGLDMTNLAVAVCIHIPSVKEAVLDRIKCRTVHFPNFISPYAWVSKEVTFGIGAIVYPGVSINYGAKIGNFVNLNMNCALGHHAQIGDYASFAPDVSLGGHTIIGQGVDMGIGSSTLQGISVGSNSIVGGKSMLIRDVPSNSKVIGVPGKVVQNVSVNR